MNSGREKRKVLNESTWNKKRIVCVEERCGIGSEEAFELFVSVGKRERE